ncbi:alanine racemase [Alkalicoccobacillus murimartini]|nr:alanine racemase [Alkalicoccobacillus murimartini]
MNAYYRDTWVEINLTAIERNVRSLYELYKDKGTEVMAVVKADGYGHGAYEAAQASLVGGATFLGVAILDEAIELRRKGITEPILVLGRTRPTDAALAASMKIAVTVFSLTWLKEAETVLKSNEPLSVHLKCDTGMGRLGLIDQAEIETVSLFIHQSEHFDFEGLYTHFATADEIEIEYYDEQFQQFKELSKILEDHGISVPYVHCANSAAALRFPERAFSMVRFGISMYGLSPSPEIKELLPFKLEPAFALKTTLAQVKKLPEGKAISYGATYVTKQDEWIGTLPIGYADGWIRSHSTNGGTVLIDGEEAPFVGRICMDQCMIRLSAQKHEGTVVTLIGVDQSSSITMDDVAKRLETINYEIPCVISKRVPRLYYRDGILASVKNPIQ